MTEFHRGRLIDHVHLRVRDLEASKRFYRAVLEAVGREVTREAEWFFTADELFVSANAEPTERLLHHGPARRSAPSVVVEAEG